MYKLNCNNNPNIFTKQVQSFHNGYAASASGFTTIQPYFHTGINVKVRQTYIAEYKTLPNASQFKNQDWSSSHTLLPMLDRPLSKHIAIQGSW